MVDIFEDDQVGCFLGEIMADHQRSRLLVASRKKRVLSPLPIMKYCEGAELFKIFKNHEKAAKQDDGL